MKKDILENKLTVKYDNELNSVTFNKLNAHELNLFFTLCAKLKEKEIKKIKFTFLELKKMIKFESTSKKRFVNIIDKTYEKMLSFTINSNNGKKRKRYNLFSGYEVDEIKEELEISVNPDLMYLINNLVAKQYTLFEHQEFINIKSTYAKNCYRLLKQYKSTGFCIFQIEKFRNLLDIPINYSMSQINSRVLNYIMKELKPIFINLTIKKNKGIKTNKIEYIEFHFSKNKIINKNNNNQNFDSKKETRVESATQKNTLLDDTQDDVIFDLE